MYIKADEEAELFASFVGKPVCVNHDKKNVVGQVMRVERDKHGEYYATLFIKDTLPNGSKVLSDIQSGKLKNISLNYATAFSKDKSGRMGKPIPIEISVVEEGGIAGTRIRDSGRDRVFVSQSGFQELSTMSDALHVNEASAAAARPTEKELQDANELANYIRSTGLTMDRFRQLVKNKDVHAERNKGAYTKNLATLTQFMESMGMPIPSTLEGECMTDLNEMDNGGVGRPILMEVAASAAGTIKKLQAEHEELKRVHEESKKAPQGVRDILGAVTDRSTDAPAENARLIQNIFKKKARIEVEEAADTMGDVPVFATKSAVANSLLMKLG